MRRSARAIERSFFWEKKKEDEFADYIPETILDLKLEQNQIAYAALRLQINTGIFFLCGCAGMYVDQYNIGAAFSGAGFLYNMSKFLPNLSSKFDVVVIYHLVGTSGPQYNNFVTKIERLTKPTAASEGNSGLDNISELDSLNHENIYRITTMKGCRVAKVEDIQSLTEGTSSAI